MSYAQAISNLQPPSAPWRKIRIAGTAVDMPGGAGETWENDRYYGTCRRHASGFFIADAPYVVIGITSIDEGARHDWRDFQRIKNELAGREWEAVELYPAESRLRDPSNRFYLWCVPKGVLAFGFDGRCVMGPDDAVAPQRPWPASEKPWLVTSFDDVRVA